jgi:hypothetical protein
VLLAITASGLVAACGSFGTQRRADSDPAMLLDPMQDTSVTTAQDAAMPSTTADAQSDAGAKTLECGDETKLCLGGGAEICCIKLQSTNKTTCLKDAAQCTGSDATILNCAYASDCGAGQVCCINRRSTNRQAVAHCTTSCAADELRMCREGECAATERCTDDGVQTEFGLDTHHEVCRPKSGMTATTMTTPL